MSGSYIRKGLGKKRVTVVVPDFLISELQWESLRLRRINKSAMWVSRTMFLPPPKDGALLGRIMGLCDGGGSGWGTLKESSLKPVEAEWAGHRSRLGDVGTRESAVIFVSCH